MGNKGLLLRPPHIRWLAIFWNVSQQTKQSLTAEPIGGVEFQELDYTSGFNWIGIKEHQKFWKVRTLRANYPVLMYFSISGKSFCL